MFIQAGLEVCMMQVFRNSPLYGKGPELCFGGHLLGDLAYPCLGWLLVPYQEFGNLTKKQKHFNFVLSSTRLVVERSFRLLKGRFQRLLHCLCIFDLQEVCQVVMACCVLHMCLLTKDQTEDMVEALEMEHPLPVVSVESEEKEMKSGADKRDAIATQL